MNSSPFLTVAGMLDDFNEGEYELDGVNVYRMNDQGRSWLRNEKIDAGALLAQKERPAEDISPLLAQLATMGVTNTEVD